MSTPLALELRPRAPEAPGDAVRAFYCAALGDFRRWSEDYNMHFGYWTPGMSLFDREAMLERMNVEVTSCLRLPPHLPYRVMDFGCGTGATARSIARRHPRCEITAVTVVPEQVELGRALNGRAGVARRIAFMLADYRSLWTGSRTQDAAYAIESFCHAGGPDKADVVREAARVLRPGARLVVVDCFLLREPRGILGAIYRLWCRSWAVDELARLDAFKRAMADAGFDEIEVRDLFAHVAPSAAHIPVVATTHMLKMLWESRGRVSAWRWRHIAASWLSIVLGLSRGTFRHALVTARRKV